MASSVRDRLLRSAEALFSERGLEAVSLREINSAAGSKNPSALQYHFGDRVGLVMAVLERHQPEVESRRHAMLDEYEATRRGDLRSLAAALVRPFAAKLDTGSSYLRLLADMLNQPIPLIDPSILDNPGNSIHRWRALVAALMPEGTVRRHRRFAAMQFALTELARRTRRPAGRGSRDHRLFVSQLIDLVAAVLSAPLSDETRALVDERARRSAQPQRQRSKRRPRAK